LQNYYQKIDTWQFPDFSDKCPICGGKGCATFHGYYFRTAICPQIGFSTTDLPISRYLCHDKGNARVCDHVTFSLLPYMLVPFQQLSLNFMIKAVWLRLSRRLSLSKAMDAIEMELNHLEDVADFINISSLLFWQQMILMALERFLSSDPNIVFQINREQLDRVNGFKNFIEILLAYQSWHDCTPIRGPDAFALDFYQQSGGVEKSAHFLFGRASQHRD
jgi:hypothetical protein